MRILAVLLCLIGAAGAQTQYTISTVAGGGPPDGARATEFAVQPSDSLATDASGNLYVPAINENRIFKITPDGRATTFAGLGTPGYSGDGGPAVLAQLRYPSAVASDAAGNIYIIDSWNSLIRKVSPAGLITTVAGKESGGENGGDGGPATSAQLVPWGVAVDSNGNLYITESLNNRVRKVTADGVISTIAGTGVPGYSGDGGPGTSATLNRPVGVALDASGNVYIVDGGNIRIRRLSPAGIITTVAGSGVHGFAGDGGPATLAALGAPRSIAIDRAGNLLIADYRNNRLRRVDAAGTITTIAGTGVCGAGGDGGPAVLAMLCAPSGLGLDQAGNIYVVGDTPGLIRRISPAGVITRYAGNGDRFFSGEGGPAVSAQMQAAGVDVDGAGNLYVADFSSARVLRVSSAGIISTVARLPAVAVKLDGSGTPYVIDEPSSSRVYKLSPQGVLTTIAGTGVAGYGGDNGPATSAQLSWPQGLAVDGRGNVYVADMGNNRVRRISTSGLITTVAGNGLFTFDGDGGAATNSALRSPERVAVDASDNIYIADSLNYRLRKVSSSGVISTVAGTGPCWFVGDGGPATSACLAPMGVAVDSAGNLFVGDGTRIRRVSPDGIITTIAGSSTSGYSGDGGPATNAQLSGPGDIAVDRSGNIFFTDGPRIRKLTPQCIPQVSPSAINVPGGAGSSSIEVTIPARCSWTATTATPWLTITFGATGTGSGTVIFQLAANATGAARTGKITVAGVDVPITQTALSACAFSLTSPPARIPATGQTGTLTLTTTGCSWTASSDQTWAQVGPPLSGTTTATLSYRVFPNLRTSARFAHFTIGGQIWTIAQEGNAESAMSRFVRLLYFGFLGRNPSQAEIAAQANSGLSRETLALNFFNSAEFKAGGRFVAALYIAMLRRDAEYGGWQFQRLALADSGGGQVALAQAYIGTPEFVMRYGELTDAAFIREMYVNILGRTPSQAEIDWQLPNVRKTNGRGAFVTAMVQVPEFETANQKRLQAFLLYSTLLMRPTSAAELDTVMQQLQAPGALNQLISAFLNSTEVRALIE